MYKEKPEDGKSNKQKFGDCKRRIGRTEHRTELCGDWGSGALVVKCFLCKHEYLSSDPSIHMKKQVQQHVPV